MRRDSVWCPRLSPSGGRVGRGRGASPRDRRPGVGHGRGRPEQHDRRVDHGSRRPALDARVGSRRGHRPGGADGARQAGALVSDVKRAAAEFGLTWAPDPTSEAESTVGGAVACNASGPRTLWYGPTRRHVRAFASRWLTGGCSSSDGTSSRRTRPGTSPCRIRGLVRGERRDARSRARGGADAGPTADGGGRACSAVRSECTALQFVVAAREAGALAPRCIEYFDAAAVAIAQSADHGRLSVSDGRCMV